jgi:hypothetical protein
MIPDHIAVERDVIGTMRRGAGGDEDDAAVDDLFADGVGDCDARRRNKTRRTLIAIDLMPPQVVFDPLPLVRDDVVFAVHEIGDGDAVDGDVDRAFAEAALSEAGERQRRLAQRLRGNGAGVDAGAAEDRLALDERDILPKVRRLRSALLAGRSGADDDEVVHF